jgi:hypothetical protein
VSRWVVLVLFSVHSSWRAVVVIVSRHVPLGGAGFAWDTFGRGDGCAVSGGVE